MKKRIKVKESVPTKAEVERLFRMAGKTPKQDKEKKGNKK
jgi:hypothetical protein